MAQDETMVLLRPRFPFRTYWTTSVVFLAFAAAAAGRAQDATPGLKASLFAADGASAVRDTQGEAAAAPAEPVTSLTVPAGVPLYVKVTTTTNLKHGTAVDGVLLEPVYVYDRIVLPVGSIVHGRVSGTTPVHGRQRAEALLNGDVTPLKMATVRFDRVMTPAGEVTLDAEGGAREIKPVRFVAAGKRPSLLAQGKTMLKERIASTKAVFGPGKRDRALKLLYSQMPYHPQRIWAGTTFITDTTTPFDLAADGRPKAEKAADDPAALNNVHVMARLAADVSSDHAAKGDVVTAVVTVPVFDAEHRLLLPEGAHLTGHVMQAKASRSFARNGQLRFLFQQVERPGEEAETAYGVVKSAAGEGAANLSLDSEGGVKANPDKNKLLAPVLLGILAMAGHDRDRDGGEAGSLGRQTVAANGFGLLARVVTLSVNDRNVATGFGAYAFAKSVYFRWIARGQPVMFARDTPVEVQLQTR